MRILDVGCGQVPKLISNYLEIEVVSCDSKAAPGVEVQDMESLTYSDDFFDLAICVNALDHTKDAKAAVKEMLRVGYSVYINCALDQMTRHGKKHYWDVKEDGRFVNAEGEFSLKNFGFEINCEDGRMMAWFR